MTINDVAKLGGVSITTVSRVINNKCVAKKTKEKILRIIEKYDYYPNSFARYLGQRNGRFSRRNESVCNKGR